MHAFFVQVIAMSLEMEMKTSALHMLTRGPGIT